MDHPIYLRKTGVALPRTETPTELDAKLCVNESPSEYQRCGAEEMAMPIIPPDKSMQYISSVALLNSADLWEQDRAARFNLPLLNAAFRESVPSLEFLQWEILDIKRGYAETRLPLNVNSTNQYISHQAALQLVAADYTGGLALASLFHLVPVLGFWESWDGEGIVMWGGAAQIKWLEPSCDDLICRSSVPIENWEQYIRRLKNHQIVVVTLQVDLYNGSTRVAETQFTYWAQDLEGMRRNATDQEKINLVYLHKLKTTAKLIAGLRALETEKPATERLCYDAYAKPLAGKHGVTIALRFNNIIPELQCMVASRTKHLDMTAQAFLKKHPKGNIVNIGAGYDTRFWRLPGTDRCKIYELDIPAMLAERKRYLRYDLKKNVVCIPIDLHRTSITTALLSDPLFNTEVPTLYIWEGGSMYFDYSTGGRILDALSRLTAQCPESRLWLDYVSMDVVCGCTRSPAVSRFINTMRKMGDPFIGGIADIDICAREHHMTVLESTTYAGYLGLDDSFDKQYCFAVLKRDEFYHRIL